MVEEKKNLALSIEHRQQIRVAADGSASRGYETFIKKYVGLIESGLLAKLSGTANKLLDALGLRARILADSRRPGSEEEFQELKSLGIATEIDRGELFCFAPLEQLARDTGISSLHTVESGIDQLIKLGIVRKASAKGQPRLASGRFGSNVYFIQPASFIGKFDGISGKTEDDSDRWQKLPTADASVRDSPLSGNRAIKRIEQKQKEDEFGIISKHFANCIREKDYHPSDKEIRKIAALLAEGYRVGEICDGISRAVSRATAAGKNVRSIAYCIPAVRENATQETTGRAELGTPKRILQTGKPQAEFKSNPEQPSKDEIAKLADGNSELRDLLEIVQERNPGRILRKSDVRAWRAVADGFRDLAIARETTPFSLVMQAVLKAIGSNSDRDGFFAPSLAQAILEDWQRDENQRKRIEAAETQTFHRNNRRGSDSKSASELPSFETPEGIVTAEQVWSAALKELQGQMTKATFDAWVRSTFVADVQNGDEPTIVIGTRNPYAVEWLEQRMHTTIQRTVVGIVGKNFTVKYRCITREMSSEK